MGTFLPLASSPWSSSCCCCCCCDNEFVRLTFTSCVADRRKKSLWSCVEEEEEEERVLRLQFISLAPWCVSCISFLLLLRCGTPRLYYEVGVGWRKRRRLLSYAAAGAQKRPESDTRLTAATAAAWSVRKRRKSLSRDFVELLCVCVWLGESFHVAQRCCYPQVEMCQSFAFYTYLWPWPLSYPTVFSVTSSFLSSHGWAKTRTRTRDVITYSYTVQSTKFSPLLSLLLLSSIYLYIGELDSWKSIRRAAVFLFTIDCCYVEKTGQAQSGNDVLSFNLFSWASRCLIQSEHLYHATVLWLINYSRKFPWLLGQTDLISRLETPSPRLDRMNLIIFPPIT